MVSENRVVDGDRSDPESREVRSKRSQSLRNDPGICRPRRCGTMHAVDAGMTLDRPGTENRSTIARNVRCAATLSTVLFVVGTGCGPSDVETSSGTGGGAGHAGSGGSRGSQGEGGQGGLGQGGGQGGPVDNCRSEVGVTYYVAPDGTAGNPGSFDAPFASVQEAHDHPGLQPGDVICLRGGVYHPGGRTRFDRVGNDERHFVVASYPGELPIIDAENVPEGDTNGGSTATWTFSDAAYWDIRGPIHLTNGRGAGVYIEDSQSLSFERVESSYNGKRAARGGHGFFVWGSATSDILFLNCDGHHNANHLWRPDEDQQVNQYQHGDGWRIFAGTEIRLVGCRAWHNLDDGFDFTQAPDPIRLDRCWAAYSGIDDGAGSITGTPNLPMSKWEGDGIKLGYDDDTGAHEATRCLSWNNHCHGWTVRGGPYVIHSSAAYNNAETAYSGIGNDPSNQRQNSYGFGNANGDGAGAESYAGISVDESDFSSVDDAGMLGPRKPDGGLPETTFLRPAPGGGLVDAGVDLGLPYEGVAPDIGPFENEASRPGE